MWEADAHPVLKVSGSRSVAQGQACFKVIYEQIWDSISPEVQ